MKCSEIKVGEVYQESYGCAVVVLAVGVERGPGLGRRRVLLDGVRVRTVYQRDHYRGSVGDLNQEQQAKTERTVASRDVAPMPEGGLQKWRDDEARRETAEQRQRDLRAALEALGFELRSQDTMGALTLQPYEANLVLARRLLGLVKP